MTSRHNLGRFITTQTLTAGSDDGAEIANALTAVLVLVSLVTLAVGGVGIMNIMLANVRARIREIGIRKALGATAREIKLQFLVEAVIISLTGGVVGTSGRPGATYFRAHLHCVCAAGFDLVGGHCAGSAVAVGVIFGTVPATRAAQMDPVETLKYE